MKFLKQFVVGSSLFVMLPFFAAVKYGNLTKMYNYYDYTMGSPIWFGLWNCIGLILAEYFGLSINMRFFVVFLLSSLNMIILAILFKAYQFTKKQWRKYYVYMILKYFIMWNIVIKYIEINICS